MTLKPPNEGQQQAINQLKDFLRDKDKGFFLLSGSAGTGKTFCLRHIIQDCPKLKLLFTAPTNKAVRVLRQALTTPDYTPDCRTIYSALGLRMEATGEIKELTKNEDGDIDLSTYDAVFVDEASMVNHALVGYIRGARQADKVKFVFLGDPAQLPPVKEEESLVWKLADESCHLIKVERFDNQILALATSLRGEVDKFLPKFERTHDNDGEEGVWAIPQAEWLLRIKELAQMEKFSMPDSAKAITWRNSNVEALNKFVRQSIFGVEATTTWLQTDRISLLGPAKDLDNNTIGTTDDEGTVLRAFISEHPVWREFKVWSLQIMNDYNKRLTLYALHADSQAEFDKKCQDLAARAKVNRRLWRDFWDFKDSFHTVRHGYCLTAHRSQGSTYNSVFVDWRDILQNPNKREAFRCLYVACSRPRKQLFLNG